MPVVANTSSGNSSSQDSYDYTTNYDSSEYCTATDVSSDDEASYNDKAGIFGLLGQKLKYYGQTQTQRLWARVANLGFLVFSK